MNLDSMFEDEEKFVSADRIAKLIGIERESVYDWRYRPQKYGTPKDLFVKFGKRVLISTEIFKEWFATRNAS